MRTEPVLSICVPSRNRQLYFQETVKALLESPRDDVEFIFADNSDDPSIMDGFMAALRNDARIVYLRSGDRTYSMMENWERSVAAATGRWVAAIGDDDYLDPDAAGFLLRLQAATGNVDALTWAGFNYIWPDGNAPPRPLTSDLSARVTRFDKRDLMRRAFQWEGSVHVPLCGNSIYHGAISRALLHRIREAFGGRFFEFPIIDYEMAFKVILAGKDFYNVTRPFSILGVCPLSNSAAMGDTEAEDSAYQRFIRELGYDIDADPLITDTPFRVCHGVTPSIFVIQHWLSRKYNFEMGGYEENLTRALAKSCETYPTRQGFELMAARFQAIVSQWQDGRYASLFAPVFRGRDDAAKPATSPGRPPWTGLDGKGTLHFREDAGGAQTPGELFAVLRAMLTPADEIQIPEMA